MQAPGPEIRRMRFFSLTAEDIVAAYEGAAPGLDAGLVKVRWRGPSSMSLLRAIILPNLTRWVLTRGEELAGSS